MKFYYANTLKLSNFFVFKNNYYGNINGDSILSLYEISNATFDNLTVFNNFDKFTTTVLKIINSINKKFDDQTKVFNKK